MASKKKNKISTITKNRIEKTSNSEKFIVDFFANHRRSHTAMTLDDLAQELGLGEGSSAMRVEKGKFGLSLARFLQMCEIYKLDPISLLKKALEK